MNYLNKNTIKEKLTEFENEKFEEVFKKLERNYYGNSQKFKLMCKYGKQISTNLIEGQHSALNRSGMVFSFRR